MKIMRIGLIAVVALLVCSMARAEQKAAPPAKKAATSSKQEDLDVVKGIRKSGRGLVNIATCPLEIPKQMVVEAKKHKTIGGAVTGYVAGIPIGCGWMVYRLGVGLFDFFTFPIPTPRYDQTPIDPPTLLPEDPITHH